MCLNGKERNLQPMRQLFTRNMRGADQKTYQHFICEYPGISSNVVWEGFRDTSMGARPSVV